MLELNPQIEALLDAGSTLVVPTRQRATAVRLAYAAAAVRAGRRVWRSPDAVAWSGWLEREWSRGDTRGLRLLRPAEEWVLWRDVAAEASRELPPLFRGSMAEGLRRAAALLAEWAIPLAALGGAAGAESLLLARALRAFEARCAQLARLAPIYLPGRLLERLTSTGPLRLAGFEPPSAMQARIAAWAQAADAGSDTTTVPARARVLAAGALDRDHELELIAAWSRRRLEADPGARLLVVLPDLAERGTDLARLLRAALAPDTILGFAADGETPAFAIEGGRPLASYPLVAHALEALAACGSPVDYPRLSAWLRAPFWARPDAGARARIDLWLRDRGRTAFDLRALAETLQAAPAEACPDAPALRSLVRAAVESLGRGQAPLTQWAERFRAALESLGWPGLADPGTADQQLHARFIELLREYGEIGLTVPPCGLAEALGLLRDLAGRIAFEPATGDSPVTVTGSSADPIVDYDGIWVAGLEADAWPAPARPDPFIPIQLQRAAGMPQASPAGQLALARAAMAAWRRRAPELVLSHARRIDDARGVPSPLIDENATASYEPAGRSPSLATTLRTADALEACIDDVAPVWPGSLPLPAGTRALELQNQCPFRAFAELRLAARPIDGPQPGVDLRTRGRLLHRALETLWRELGGSEGLAAFSADSLAPLIARHAQAAAAQILEVPAAEAEPRVNERELRRAVRLIGELCELERERAPFTVQATELSRRLELPEATLSVRLDRIDRLSGGSLAIVDYKTGRAGRQQWLEEPVSHPQLLAYLLAVDGDVAALAMAHVARTGVEFKGIAAARDLIPNLGPKGTHRSRESGPDIGWPEQLNRWRAIARRLIRDFVAGAAAVDPIDGACDTCHLQAFCRIGDQPAGNADADHDGDEHD